jgi:predicted ATPase
MPISTAIRTIRLRGFKSIRDATLSLSEVNILIGPNGAGKTNLIEFFRLLESILPGTLARYVMRSGGASGLLHYGPKETSEISVEIGFHTPEWPGATIEFSLEYAADDSLFWAHQEYGVSNPASGIGHRGMLHPKKLEPPQRECVLVRPDHSLLEPAGPDAARALLRQVHVFHFQDTSARAAIRRHSDPDIGQRLQSQGENLAAFLLHLSREHRPYYDRIVATIRQVMPELSDFVLEPSDGAGVLLRWRSRSSDYELGPHQLSDGSLRFVALASLLLQPEISLPSVLVIDEPELGLHPFAIQILAGLVRSCSQHCQLILATQSTTLLDAFDPEDVIVCGMDYGQSRFHRLPAGLMEEWLENYSLSEMWEKNIIGGRP